MRSLLGGEIVEGKTRSAYGTNGYDCIGFESLCLSSAAHSAGTRCRPQSVNLYNVLVGSLCRNTDSRAEQYLIEASYSESNMGIGKQPLVPPQKSHQDRYPDANTTPLASISPAERTSGHKLAKSSPNDSIHQTSSTNQMPYIGISSHQFPRPYRYFTDLRMDRSK